MDIDILLALQNARLSAPGSVEKFFSYLTYLGTAEILAIVVLAFYWCINKRAGLFVGISISVSIFITQVVKVFACVYRPWIRDARIKPAASAVPGASGYSFPSGHTTGAGSCFGAIAWLSWKKHKVVSVLLWVLVGLVGFSRLFLDVHTPQDVLVGLLVSIAGIALTQVFFNWIERLDREQPGHNKDVTLAVIVLVVCAILSVVILLKPYPMDYVNGQLLVDPEKMMKDGFKGIGLLAGAALGWVLERRYVNFTTDGISTKTRVIRGVVGLLLVAAIYICGDLLLALVIPAKFAKLIAIFGVAFSGIFLVPFIFSKIEKKLANR